MRRRSAAFRLRIPASITRRIAVCRKVCVLGDRWLRHWRDHEQARARLPPIRGPFGRRRRRHSSQGGPAPRDGDAVSGNSAVRGAEPARLAGAGPLNVEAETLRRKPIRKSKPCHCAKRAGVDPNGSSRWPPCLSCIGERSHSRQSSCRSDRRNSRGVRERRRGQCCRRA